TDLELAAMIPSPTLITHVNLRWVYETTLAAAAQAGVDLGAPFTRRDGHPQHREWYAAIEVHRALSFARLKVRKPPGTARAKAQRRKRGGAMRQAAVKIQREHA